jgi:hypothetical protein
MKLWVCTTKEFLHKLSETISGKMSCRTHQGLDMSTVRHRNRLGKMLTFDGHWQAGEVCSSWINRGFNCTGQMADNMYGVV